MVSAVLDNLASGLSKSEILLEAAGDRTRSPKSELGADHVE